jgi:restriction endonuclease Mrr
MYMTYLDAALRVLNEAPGGGPLHYREITDRAIEQGYLRTAGKTPWQTMGARLYVAIKEDDAAGKPARFIQSGRGSFQLSQKGPSAGIDRLVADARLSTREALLARLKEISPTRFEQVVGQLLTLIGFEDVEVMGRSGDRGIDAVGRLTVGGITNVSTAIQAKRWTGTVPSRVIREMRGSLQIGQRGTIITTSCYTPDGIAEAAAEGKEPISLIDGEKLVDLLVKYEYGVKKRSVELLELDLEVLDIESDNFSASTEDSRNVSQWPLPASKGGYGQVILDALRETGPLGISRDDLATWFSSTFKKVNSRKTSIGYVNALRYSGFLRFEGEVLKATPSAQNWLEEPSNLGALKILEERVLGVSEMLLWLKEAPLTKAELLDRMNSEFPFLMWKTGAQVGFRLTWLSQFQAIARNGNSYTVNQQDA